MKPLIIAIAILLITVGVSCTKTEIPQRKSVINSIIIKTYHDNIYTDSLGNDSRVY